MIRITPPAALILGLALGASAVCAWTALGQRAASGSTSGTYASADLTKVRPAALSIDRLADTLMLRVSRELVHVDAPERPMLGGALLYDQPTGFGHFLCEVRAYRFPSRIVRGRRSSDDQNWQPTLEVERMYAVWREPNAKSSSDEDSRACKDPINPRALISGDALDVEAAAEMLDWAASQARKGALPFKVTCVDARSPPKDTACDGLDLLRRASATQIRQVLPDEEHETASGASSPDWTQMVFLDAASLGDGCGQSETLSLNLIHGPLRRSHSLHGIAIRRDVIC